MEVEDAMGAVARWEAGMQVRMRFLNAEERRSEWVNGVVKAVDTGIWRMLEDDGILVIPTALGCSPKLNSWELSSTSYNAETLYLQSLSSMSGCCQASRLHRQRQRTSSLDQES